MAELSEELKQEIVKRLACFEDIGEIVKDFRLRGIETEHKQIGSYDPTKSYFEAGDWARDLFESVRKAFVEDAAAVPVANQGFRLNLLQEGIQAARKAKNWKLVAELAEQASKEVGGAFTNERNMRIDDSRRQHPRDMTAEDRQNMLAEVIRKALEGMQIPGAQPQERTVQ